MGTDTRHGEGTGNLGPGKVSKHSFRPFFTRLEPGVVPQKNLEGDCVHLWRLKESGIINSDNLNS